MSAPQKPPLQNPILGTAVDTSSSTLHSRAPTDEDESRLSGSVVQRVVDRIQHRTSLVKRSGHKKLLSLSKKHTPQEHAPQEHTPQDGKQQPERLFSVAIGGISRVIWKDNEGSSQAQKTRSPTEVESPFMQPDDSPPSSRPSLADSFRGDGSVRGQSAYYMHRVLSVYSAASCRDAITHPSVASHGSMDGGTWREQIG